MHVLSIITAQETDLNAKIFSGPCNTLEGQVAMPRSMLEPSITAVGPIITETGLNGKVSHWTLNQTILVLNLAFDAKTRLVHKVLELISGTEPCFYCCYFAAE